MKKQFHDLQDQARRKENANETVNIDETDVENDLKTEEKKKKIVETRKMKRKNQKDKKEENFVKVPTIGKNIYYREKGSDKWKPGRVVGSFKTNSKYKHWKHVQVKDGLTIEVDFKKNEWKDESEVGNDDIIDTFVMTDIDDKVFPVKIIPPKEYNRPEIQEAMSAEILKFKSFEAFREVPNEGQTSVPIRWVVTEQKADGKNQPYKARLCIRGDLERGKEHIRADSPTASKETMKLALIVAANEGFEVKAVDIKSAFLQGAKLDREVFVRPPSEANTDNKLWLLSQGAYGILDGGRLFYLRLSERLQELGMHKVHSDGALFTYVKDGKLQGLVASHVDDLIMTGNETFQTEILQKLNETFKFSKIEEKSFKYCGCNIVSQDDGSIELDQNDYIDSLQLMEHLEGEDDKELTDKQKKDVRGKIGELLWITLMTRPDLSVDVNLLSSEVSNGTVKTAKTVNKVLKKAKNVRNSLRFAKLGDLSKLSVKAYADASYGNQDNKTRSTEGRVILIENKENGLVNVVSWKTKKIARVCRSVKGAETRALEEAVDDAVNTARLIKEIYTGKVNLKNPEQIPVEAFTDSKSLWENIHNTRQCDEKLLRNSIAGIKELVELQMLKNVHWVPTGEQLADCMTKLAKNANWLLKVASSNRMDQ